MGKRKSKARVMTKKRKTTAEIFDCPFCNHTKTVECKFDKEAYTAEIFCRVCGVSFQMPTTNLTKPIDVFAEWIDQAEEKNREEIEDYKDVKSST